MSVFSDLRFAMQDGADYIDLSDNLTEIAPRVTPSPILTDTMDDSPFPRVDFGNQRAELNIGGLIYDPVDPAKDFSLMTSGDEVLFALLNTVDDLVGPVGYVKLDDPQLITQIGVIRGSGVSPAQRKDGAERWRYGRFLPVVYNSNRPSTLSGYFEAPAGAWILLNVVSRGGLTALEVTYTISGTTYRLIADLVAGEVAPQLKLGQLLDGTTPIPSKVAGTWRVSRSGSASGAKVYIGVLE